MEKNNDNNNNNDKPKAKEFKNRNWDNLDDNGIPKDPKDRTEFIKSMYGGEMPSIYEMMASIQALEMTQDHFAKLRIVFKHFHPNVQRNINDIIKGWLVASVGYDFKTRDITQNEAMDIHKRVDDVIRKWWVELDEGRKGNNNIAS